MTVAAALPGRWEAGGLTFTIHRRPCRSTLEITVERDASLAIKVPDGATLGQVEAFVDAKRRWASAISGGARESRRCCSDGR